MPNDKLSAFRELVKELEAFLESGMRSGGGEDDEPPERDDVRKGGPLHSAIVAVEAFYGGKLPAPVPRNAWLRLTRSRDAVDDPVQWQTIAHETASQIVEWANRELSLANPGNQTDDTGNSRKRMPDNPDVRDLCHELDRERRRIERGEVSAIQVARNFTHGNSKKAANLLRQARRFRHLWTGADK